MGYTNDREAFILANTYGFCPPRVPIPDGTEDLDHGKFEPDNFPEAAERWMLLAQPIDHTAILLLYEPDNLPP